MWLLKVMPFPRPSSPGTLCSPGTWDELLLPLLTLLEQSTPESLCVELELELEPESSGRKGPFDELNTRDLCAGLETEESGGLLLVDESDERNLLLPDVFDCGSVEPLEKQ